MRLIKSFLLFVLILSAVIFIVQNLETVKLSFLKWSIELPLSIASAALFFLGGVSGGLVISLIRKLTWEEDSNEYS